MTRLGPAVALVALALACATGASAQAPTAAFPVGWSHAAVNVIQSGQRHTFVYDRGRVTAVSASSVTMAEPDGSSATIALSATTVVKVDGKPGTLASILQLDRAQTLCVDGGAATLVQVQTTAAATKLARKQARQAKRGAFAR